MIRFTSPVVFPLLLAASLLGAPHLTAQRAEAASQDATCPATPGAGWVTQGTLDISGGRSRWEDYPLIVQVKSGSAAERAGFKSGDVLLQQDGRDLTEPIPLGQSRRLTMGRHRVIIRRGVEEMELFITICRLAPSRSTPRS